jgi:hypothetical protein
MAESVARGYPLTVLLAVLLVFLAGLAVFRKVRSLARGWSDAHVPLVVRPGRYDEVAADLDRALEAAGLSITPRTAPAAMSKPARWLAAVAGTGAASLVPERMIQLDGEGLDILIYPMDLLVSGEPSLVARARAAMASRLATTAAYMTTSAEAQRLEDRLAEIAGVLEADGANPPRFDEAAAAEFAAIDEELAVLEIPYDEWEALYRQRLQIERDLRAGAMAGEAVVGAETPGLPGDGPLAALREAGRVARAGLRTVLEVAADERTGDAIDRIAGPQWRWAARAATVAASAARVAVQTADEADPPPREDGAPA